MAFGESVTSYDIVKELLYQGKITIQQAIEFYSGVINMRDIVKILNK